MSSLPKKITSRRRQWALRGMLIFSVLLGLSHLIPNFWHRGEYDAYEEVDFVHLMYCVKLSSSSYHEPQAIQNEFGSHVEVIDFPESGMRVILDRDPNGEGLQWVVLRGTANLTNFFTDLDFIEREDHELGIRVHRGFDKALQECLPWVIERLDKNRPICITGHSLGGSVGVLLAVILDRRGYTDVSAVTFGQPKVTDSHGAETLEDYNVLRIAYEEDPVPLIPPFIVGDGNPDIYHHFGAEVILKENGHFFYAETHNPGRMDVAEYWSSLSHISPKSHLLGESYIPAIKAALKRSSDIEKPLVK